MLLISLITAAQVILIIKIWMMTSDVRKIRQKLNEPQAENRKITEALRTYVCQHAERQSTSQHPAAQ